MACKRTSSILILYTLSISSIAVLLLYVYSYSHDFLWRLAQPSGTKRLIPCISLPRVMAEIRGTTGSLGVRPEPLS